MAGGGDGGVVQVLLRMVREILQAALRSSTRSTAPRTRSAPPKPAAPPAPPKPAAPPAPRAEADRPAYTGDATEVPTLRYEPFDDDRADPGEIVWAWVPFEEDHTRGKDRPVLVIGRRRGRLLALMLTSQDHDRDAADEARHGRHWVDIGTGAWDPRHRRSEVRVDRVLQLDADSVRRQGATLDRARFDEVAAAVRAVHRG
jgi:hypothetical protein